MFAHSKQSFFAVLVFSLLVLSCATPIPPTGGVSERTAPKIVSSVPASGTTNFTSRTIRVEFDRYMSRNSIQRSIQIEPDLGIPYTIDWNRKSMLIRFQRSFPDSVTAILSLGTDISDVNGNRLASPYKIAFSTGSSIDSASVDFSVFSFDVARGVSGQKVGLFREGDKNGAAIYIAESDTSGSVKFNYVRNGTYYASIFEDKNRNRVIDENEYSLQFGRKIEVEGDSSTFAGHFVFSRQDTIAPRLLGVGLLSSDRLRLRFSESIRLTKESSISIVDKNSTSNSGIWMYSDPADASIGIGRSSVKLDSRQEYHVEVDSVSDLLGNYFSGKSSPFSGSTRSDSTTQRIIRIPDPVIVLPTDTFLVVYSDIISSGAIIDSLIIIDGEDQIRNWSGKTVKDNKLYVYKTEGWRPGQSYQIRYWSPIDQRYRTQSFRVQRMEELASIELQIPENWLNKQIVVEVLDINGMVSASVIETPKNGKINISPLAPGTYRMRAWLDINANGRWDQWSSSQDDRKKEPVYIQPGFVLSARMTSVLLLEEIF